MMDYSAQEFDEADDIPDDPLVDKGGTELYWARKEAAEVISELQAKEKEHFSTLERRGLLRMWRVQWAQYYGQEPDSGRNFDSQMITVAGENGELLSFRLQEVRPLITRQIQMAIGERAAFMCHAVNTDYSTRAQINICDAAVEYTYRKSHSERKERDIVEGDSNFGYSFGWCRWDADKGDEVTFPEDVPIDPENPQAGTVPQQVTRKSGAPTVTVLYPWEVVQDPAAKEHMWRICRERTSKWELMAQYPEQAEKIRGLTEGLDEYTTEQLFRYDTNREQSTDDVIVKHFYHERCRAIPEGRYFGYVGDVMLWDMPCPVSEGMPLQLMCSERFIGTSFGYASGWDLIAPNQLIDQISSDMASNIATFGRSVIAVQDGSDIDVNALANGMRVINVAAGTQPPTPLNFMGVPESARWALEFLIRRMESISGINSVSRGDPQSNITSGSMAALFHEIAIEFQGPRQTAFDEYREGMANLQLDLIRQHAKAPFLIEVAGVDERPYLQQFTRETLSGVKRVVIKTANPMMRSVSGRMEIFNAVKDIADPAFRAASIELITTGNAKDFAKIDRSKKLSTVGENEKLAQGILVEPSEFDNHVFHWAEHQTEMEARREELMQNIPAWNAFVQHLIMHEQLYDMMQPTRCQLLGIPMSGNAQMQMQMQMQAMQMAPANENGDPTAAAEGSGDAAVRAAAQQGGAPQSSDPAQAAGVRQPSMPEPAQPPGGQAQNPGEAA